MKNIKLKCTHVFKNKFSIINKMGNYSCSCGQTAPFKVYYSNNNFSCPKCGKPINLQVSVNKKTHIKTNAEIKDWKEEDIQSFPCSYYAKKINHKLLESNDTSIKLLLEQYIVIFEDKDTYFKVYGAEIEYFKDTEEIKVIDNLKSQDKVQVSTSLIKEIIHIYTEDNSFKEDIKQTDLIKATPGFAFLEENNLLNLLSYHTRYINNDFVIFYSNKKNLDLTKTNLKDITGLSKEICKDIMDINRNEFFSKGLFYDYAYIFNFYYEEIINKKRDINVVRSLQKMALRLSERESENSNALKGIFRGSLSTSSAYEFVSNLYYKYNYNLKRLEAYLYDILFTQGVYIDDALILLRDYNEMCGLLEAKRYEKYPSSLKKEHDIAMIKYSLIKSEIDEKRFKQIKEENIHLEDFSDEEYDFILPESANDLFKEGESLRHCVASYADRVVHNQCLIVFLRKKDGSSSSTIELRDRQIIQHKAFGNKQPSKKEVELTKDWAEKHQLLYA